MALSEYLVSVKSMTNICFDCQKACGGCSWSELDPDTLKTRFKPVPGWTAEKVKYQTQAINGGAKFCDTYHITACPEFVRDEPRKSERKELSDRDWELLLWVTGRVRYGTKKVNSDG